MSGHSKWSKIKRQKGEKDVQKGNLFSKLSRMITLAVIESGGATDPEYNVKLRLAIDKAKSENLPRENITRAIEKGIGPDKAQLKEVIYEGFAPGGVALIILATTDSHNRTLTEIRNIMERHGGKLAGQGSVSYLFQKCGLAILDKKLSSEDEIFAFAEKINAFDMDQNEALTSIYFPFENLGKIKSFQGRLELKTIDVDFKPSSTIKIENRAVAKKILELIELLEGLEDVLGVYANFYIPDEYLN